MPDRPEAIRFRDTFHTFSMMVRIYRMFFFACCLGFLALIVFGFLFELIWVQAMMILSILFFVGIVFFYTYYSNWASKKLIVDQFNCPKCGASRFYRNMMHVPGGGFPTVKGFARLEAVCLSCGHDVRQDT